MNFDFPVVNSTSELEDCRNDWTFDQTFHCWCLEDILYTQKATTPKFQRMSIFVPAAYLNAKGTVDPNGCCGEYTSLSAPVIFENNSAGYMQMPHTWLGGPRDEAGKYLAAGMVYVTCGCRGRESRNTDGVLCGKAPWTLIDLKTGLRFLRHNASVLPGDFSHIISVGWSAGGAMSALLGVTGDNPLYDPYLEQNGAFLSESDTVFASQIYCPIVDLEHADLAYEWQFHKDDENEDSPAGPAGKMTSFMKALSQKLSERYIQYFNSLGLHAPDGTPLAFGPDGRSGTAYSALMDLLNDSASDFLHRLDCGTLDVPYTVSDYLAGHYTVQKPAPAPKADRTELLRGHAGPGVALNTNCDSPASPSAPPSLGDLVSRPPKGVPYHGFQPPMIEVPGDEKSDWLYWNGERAVLTDLDSYLLHHRRRMKPCTSFDTLGMDSGENQEFGTPARDYMHFCTDIAASIAELKDSFPSEYNKYYISYAACIGDTDQEQRKFLINPLNFIGTSQPDSGTKHYRIRVGAQDADTAFIISLTLAAKLQNVGKDTDYALVWDKPHCQADYPGEIVSWIKKICH